MMIVLDLEWNRSYDNNPLEEILQIGAVQVEYLGGPVVDQFLVYIRPSIHRRFGPGARDLPDLQDSKDSQITFPTAIDAFRDWCGGVTVFASWGSDLKTLEQNCRFWNKEPPVVEKTYDLQSAFSWAVGTRQQVSLNRAVEYCGMPDSFTFHNALNDAMYTSLVAAWIPSEFQRDRLSTRFSALAFRPQPILDVGPLPSLQDVLNCRASRKSACPVCGRTVWVLRWLRRGSRLTPWMYYGVFSCPDHGRFLCRLTVQKTGERTWQATHAVPKITPELVEDFGAAEKCGKKNTFVCRSEGCRRRSH